jgi:hypothetical protein
MSQKNKESETGSASSDYDIVPAIVTRPKKPINSMAEALN